MTRNTLKQLLFLSVLSLAFLFVTQPVLAAPCSAAGIHTCSVSVPPSNCVNNGGGEQCVVPGAAAQGPLKGLRNVAIPTNIGGDPVAASNGSTFAHYFILLWQGIIVVGTLAMLFNLINGALEWVTAGGESEKVKHARMKMTEGVVGLIILVGTFAAIMFLGQVLGFNVLKFTIPQP